MLNVVNAGAQLRITQSGAYRQGYRHFECLSFVNVAPKIATRVQFDFIYFDAQKHFIGSDSLVRTGQFEGNVEDKAPFERVSAPHGIGEHFDLGDYKNCLAYQLKHEGIAYNVVTVKRVEYADGTYWEAPPDATPTPQPSTTPNTRELHWNSNLRILER
jgi:hypothetical protein